MSSRVRDVLSSSQPRNAVLAVAPHLLRARARAGVRVRVRV